jgi:hypothetical protein
MSHPGIEIRVSSRGGVVLQANSDMLYRLNALLGWNNSETWSEVLADHTGAFTLEVRRVELPDLDVDEPEADVVDVGDVAERSPTDGILCANFAYFADADKAQANDSYKRSSTSLRGDPAFLQSAVDRAVAALWDCKPF